MKSQFIKNLVLILIFLLVIIIKPSRADLDNFDGMYLTRGPYIKSPSNETYNSGFLVLYVNFPARIYGNINYSIVYSLDEQNNVTFVLVKHNFGWQYQDKNYLDGSVELPALSTGSHRLTVYVQSAISTYDGTWHSYADIESQTVYFTVFSSIRLLMEYKTYNSTEIPLNFFVNGMSSKITYSLDNQANKTITGNTTLTGLTEGTHSLIIYANNKVENVTNFDIATFTINKPLSPSQIPSQTHSSEFLSLILLLFLAIALLSVVFIVRKRKAKKFLRENLAFRVLKNNPQKPRGIH